MSNFCNGHGKMDTNVVLVICIRKHTRVLFRNNIFFLD